MRRLVSTVLLLAALGGVSGCAAADPVFDNEGDRPVGCMAHQPEAPGERYTDPEQRDTGEVLAVLKYYTANGTKPYCDGAGPTEADRAWGQLYTDLDGPREKVAGVVG